MPLTLPSIHQEDKKIDATVGKLEIRNTFATPVTMSDVVVVLSIKDIPYPIVPDTAFHPINTEAAFNRIRNQLRTSTNIYIQQSFEVILLNLYKLLIVAKKMQTVWATVFEYEDQPLYIVRNLAHTNTTLPYRRVLVVRCYDFNIPYPMRTWDRVSSSLSHGEFYPSPSETMSQ